MGRVKDGERSTQTGLEGQVPGNSEQRATKSPAVHWAKEPLSQELWWQESHLAGCAGGHGWKGD